LNPFSSCNGNETESTNLEDENNNQEARGNLEQISKNSQKIDPTNSDNNQNEIINPNEEFNCEEFTLQNGTNVENSNVSNQNLQLINKKAKIQSVIDKKLNN